MGIAARSVSVKSATYSTEASVTVAILTPELLERAAEIEVVAKAHALVTPGRGGNIYVHVNGYKAREVLRARAIEAAALVTV